MEQSTFETATANVYRELDGCTILGAWRVQFVPHTLVLIPLAVSIGVVPSWSKGEEIQVGWDDEEGFEVMARPHGVKHHEKWVRIVPYEAAVGVEGSEINASYRPAELDREELPSASRLVEAIIAFLLDTGRVSLGHYLEVVCPK